MVNIEDTTKVVTAYHNGNPYQALLNYSKDVSIYTVILTIEDQTISGSGYTLHNALLEIREEIEPAGWMVGVQSSRARAGNVFNQDNHYDDSVNVINSLQISTTHAFTEAPYEQLATIDNQRVSFQEAYAKIKQSEKYVEEFSAKKKKKKRNIAKEEANPYDRLLLTLTMIAAIVFFPLMDSVIASQVITFGSVTIPAFIMLPIGATVYGLNVSVAYEYIRSHPGSAPIILVALLLPLLAAAYIIGYSSHETSSLIRDFISQKL